jgi:cytochrome c oxidase subunit IV
MEEHNTTHTDAPQDVSHAHNDNAVIMGRELPMPVYTVVFAALGILTLIEVTLSQAPRGFLTIPIMLIIATTKAGLVVWFYMHLNKDSRVFAVTLMIPFFMVVICTLFLMMIPTGY